MGSNHTAKVADACGWFCALTVLGCDTCAKVKLAATVSSLPCQQRQTSVTFAMVMFEQIKEKGISSDFHASICRLLFPYATERRHGLRLIRPPFLTPCPCSCSFPLSQKYTHTHTHQEERSRFRTHLYRSALLIPWSPF